RELIGEVGRLRTENEKLSGALTKLKVEHQAVKEGLPDENENGVEERVRVILAIHFDEHITINITQSLHDPTLSLVTFFLIEVRGGFVRFDRHADHKPFGYFALSEQSGQNGNPGY
ncbi:MAG: hypothetical protein WCD75_16590, partial [Rhodoplanes sp.]